MYFIVFVFRTEVLLSRIENIFKVVFLFPKDFHPDVASAWNMMGWACSTYGGDERCVQGFGGEMLGKETTWETQA